MTKTRIPLSDCIEKVLILAHKESTDQLEKILTDEGFDVSVIRQDFKPEYQTYAKSYLAMLNHVTAWQCVLQSRKPTLIVEADFVPVKGLGGLPAPFPPQKESTGITWLYTCAPQVYYISEDGYIQGWSTALVAYIINAETAQALTDLCLQFTTDPGPYTYHAWDSKIGNFLQGQGLQNYIAFRNYGEHGGVPNLEHHQSGLSKVHRADSLAGPLAFQPLYISQANGTILQFWMARLQARLKGIARVLTGSFVRVKVLKGSRFPWRLMWFALWRHFSIY